MSVVNDNYFKKVGEKGERPVDKLIVESLDSALSYSQKLTAGVREIVQYMEKAIDESGTSKSFVLSLSKYDLPDLRDIIEGTAWLLSMYDKCLFFSSAPFHPLEDSIIKRRILNAERMIVDCLEKSDGYGLFRSLKFELAPGLELLGGRVEDIAKLSNLSGHKKGIIIQ